jgi:MoxR-like ATPase
MLEAMQEKTVTISKVTHILPKPFFVMATQNPLENSGVYPLPEAQVDRFLFKILMNYPTFDEEKKILSQNITLKTFESYNLSPLLTPEKIIELQKLVLNVRSSPAIKQYIVEIVEKTRQKNLNFSKYISYGASPRASIALFVASKAEALLNGRNFVIPEDVKNVVHEVLRHRIILSYTAEAEKKSQDNIIDEILKLVEVP